MYNGVSFFTCMEFCFLFDRLLVIEGGEIIIASVAYVVIITSCVVRGLWGMKVMRGIRSRKSIGWRGKYQV